MSTWLSTVSFTPASEPTSSKPCHTTVGWIFENAVVSARTLSIAPPPPLITYVPPIGSSVGFGWIWTGLPLQLVASRASTVPRANALRPSFTLRLRPGTVRPGSSPSSLRQKHDLRHPSNGESGLRHMDDAAAGEPYRWPWTSGAARGAGPWPGRPP